MAATARAADSTPPPSPVPYAQVHAVFAKHCLSCHGSKDPDGELVMESYESLMKGGEKGPVLVPGKAAESILLRQIEHAQKPFMPPPKKGDKLSEGEIALIRTWIDAGAPGPKPGEVIATAPAVEVPKIAPKGPVRRPVQAVAFEPKSKLIAVALPGEVELRSGDGQGVIRRLGPHKGNVNDLAFTADGSRLAAAAGQPGTGGEVRLWKVADGSLVRSFEGHKDAVYAVAISPDGKTLATGSYDQKITLWDVDSGKPLRDLEGHNAVVTGLSFRSDGKVLASSSGDRTLKLWDVATGKRLDTRPESSKDLNAVAFSPDGKLVAAGGVDNRIRIWQVSAGAAEGTNPLLCSQFAHEGAILRLAWSADGKSILSSADDRTVKVWDASNPAALKLRTALPTQPDWPTALAFAFGDKAVVVGRLDGSVALYDARTGKLLPPAKPEVTAVEPRGVQSGRTSKVRLTGKNLAHLTGAKALNTSIAGKLSVKPMAEEGDRFDAAWVEVTVAADLAPGEYDVVFAGPGGESGPVKLFVDDVPQVAESAGQERGNSAVATAVPSLPADLWGKFDRLGDADAFAFDAKAGQAVVIDAAAKRLGSKAALGVTVLDAAGRSVPVTRVEENPDPLLAFTPPADGRYVVRVTDIAATAAATPAERFYRLTVGPFAYVTGCFPLGVSANATTSVQLLGFNLPVGAAAEVKAGAAGTAGEAEVPLDRARFRSRGPIKVEVSEWPELTEAEPNDRPGEAMKVPVPCSVSGRLDAGRNIPRDGVADADLFRFTAKAGHKYVIETLAGRRGSPADTRVELLHTDGSPVERVQLVAVRDSYINFRAIDANVNGARFQNWEEMQLNQYVYLSGEVVKLFLAPRGPDSDYNFYTAAAGPGAGRRKCYFDTTATSHALDEKCYVVEPHPPGEKLPETGLPVFVLHYANDDASDRSLGTDSRLHFTAPPSTGSGQADGDYLVRVTDSRGFGGERFVYRLTVREAKPDFTVSAAAATWTVPAGAGVPFTVRAERTDEFDGPIRVDVSGAPPGYAVSTPLVIVAGHEEAKGTLFATAGAPPPSAEAAAGLKATATTTLEGREVSKPVGGFGKVALGPKPTLLVSLEPMTAGGPSTQPTTAPSAPPVLTIAPGQRIAAMLKIDRHGQAGPIEFDVEDLPHGVIVSDIGLNGVLIPDGQSERQIFLECADWVAETERPCYAKARQAGGVTGAPLLLRVRRRG